MLTTWKGLFFTLLLSAIQDSDNMLIMIAGVGKTFQLFWRLNKGIYKPLVAHRWLIFMHGLPCKAISLNS
jgi:hypothetical protein